MRNSHPGPLADPIVPGHLLCLADTVQTAQQYAALVDDLATLLRQKHRATWKSEEVGEIMRLLCVAIAMPDEIDDWAEGARRLVGAVCAPAMRGR